MTKGRLREFRREPSAFFFVLFMPLLWMFILGLAFSEAVEDTYGVGIVLPKQESSLNEVLTTASNALQNDPSIKVYAGSEEQMGRWLRKDQIQLWIKAPNDGLEYHFDPLSPSAKRGKLVVDKLIQESLGRRDIITSSVKPVATRGMRYIDYLIPGLIALSLFSTSLYGTGMTIVVNRREKLLKRYKLTPMSEIAFFLSHVLGRYLIALFEIGTILAAGTLFFDFHIAGRLVDFILFCLLGTSTFTLLSILCGSRLDNSGAYSGLANMLMLPMMLLSGTWYSRSHFPDWLHYITDYLPLTALTDSLRNIALEGLSFTACYAQASILLVYLFVFGIGSKKLFRWY